MKQPNFAASEEKENISDEVAVPIKGIPMMDDEPEAPKPSAAPGIKGDEADEPILQENPNRFVLFPIKYHEVSVSRRLHHHPRKPQKFAFATRFHYIRF